MGTPYYDEDFSTTGTVYEGEPGTSSAVILTASGDSAFISRVIAENTTTAAATLSMWHGVAGAANTTSNELVPAQSCPASSETVVFDAGPDGYPLAEGDVIRALQGTSSALVVRVIGRA